MRVLILALAVLAILVSADAGKAGPSTATRDDVGIRRTGDLDRRSHSGNRGSDRPRQTKAPRRAARTDPSRLRHQGQRKVRRANPRRHHALAGARGYPGTGFLNTLQHRALLTEIAAAAQASDSDKSVAIRPVVVAGAALAITAGRWRSRWPDWWRGRWHVQVTRPIVR